MSDPIDLVPVLKLRFGAPVFTADGEQGRLMGIVVDASARTIVGLKARFGALSGLMGAELFLPAELIVSATDIEARLSAELTALRAMKADVAGILVTHSTAVTANGKGIGRVGHLTFTQATRVLRHVIVDRGLGDDVILPASAITSLTERQITCAPPERGVTLYRPDDELEADIRSRIEVVPQLFVDVPGILVTAIDGVVWVHGNVSSDLTVRKLNTLLDDVRGIDTLHLDVVPDTQLAATISAALASDPKTTGQPIGVYPRLGEVALRGRVRSDAALQAAAEIAARVPGARSVANGLMLDVEARAIPELAGVTNNEDIIPGGR